MWSEQLEGVFDDVAAERARQDELHGGFGVEGSILPGADVGMKLAVLMEEVGEVAHAINERHGWVDLEAELLQVAAVAVAWVEFERMKS